MNPGNGYCSPRYFLSLYVRVLCKIWTLLSAGSLANRADPNQTPHKNASDQGLYSLLKLQEVKV